ncbi:transmembrane protein [Sulfuricella denitrificans skB26]|uniref:Transmembrane protein n=1 Tax=Sulfuricella denitrificans (strain DSM 22764 / NBRC 105220 / skB26) TaxID=1163617 RepID=S6B1S4_SULDS|nr:YeeE/YedE family protein [Sulfuricella denitrificans]BAN34622.1 transmembrane protein [Sulfuricella denitrificans skB26]
MVFENFAQAQSFFLWVTFGIALTMGALVNKTNFCTMGAVSDWVNMGDTGRLRAWLFAIAVAMLGVAILEASGLVKLASTFPPYRANQLVWAENLLGGLMFGVGMTLASGCGNKTLVRIGGGNLKSIMVLAIIAVIAYYMVNPFPGSDKTLFTVFFYDWIRPLAVTLQTNQDLGAIIAGSGNAATPRLAIGSILALGLIGFAFISADFRSNFDNILGGLVVGLAVLAAWYVTSNVMMSADGQPFSLQNFVAEQWDMYAKPEDLKPADSRPLSAQSFTFINPMGQTLGYAMAGFKLTALTFGVMSVAGVILGSLLWSLISRNFRIEWFVSVKDFFNHFVGAILMGFGGVLAMGCTIGQGVTGVSTLAVGSIITLLAIIAGCASTMKYQYWRMMQEG